MAASEFAALSAVMENQPLTTETVKLAGLAADLSTTLCSLQEKCGHETTSTDIYNIATELALLSQSLWRLHEAMTAGSQLYTQSFNEDLSEITRELGLIFEEIADCCEELQKADAEDASTVAWMFRKGRVHKLQKHLEVLKTTVVTMRLVLWHGKDYGTHNSPGRLAESSPHTMHEDRVIMESVFAQNRNAIVDIHMLDSRCHKHSSSSTSDEPANAGNHHRMLFTSTGIECPPLSDVLPPAYTSIKSPKIKAEFPARRFSKRGVRLAVHSSILNMKADDALGQLTTKWIHPPPDHDYEGMTSLSKISEVDSTQSHINLRKVALAEPLSDDAIKKANEDVNANKPPLERNLPSMVAEWPIEEDTNSKIESDFPSKRRLSIKKIKTPLRKMVQKLSLSHDHVEEAHKSFTLAIKNHLQKPTLKTPDYEKEFENGV